MDGTKPPQTGPARSGSAGKRGRTARQRRRKARTGDLRHVTIHEPVSHKSLKKAQLPATHDHHAISQRSVDKALYIIRYVLKKLKPETLIKLVQEIIVTVETHTYGKRYPREGLPDSELRNFINPKIVVVRGARLNPFCHCLMCFSSPGFKDLRFCQLNDLDNYPEFLNEAQFREYMEKEGGSVEYVYQPKEAPKIPASIEEGGGVPELRKMHDDLQAVSRQRLLWKGLKDNCFTFCLNIMKSGDYDVSEVEGVFDLPGPGVQKALKKGRQKPVRPHSSELSISGPVTTEKPDSAQHHGKTRKPARKPPKPRSSY